jgi:hypothetical protein
MCMSVGIFTDMNTNACDQKKLMLAVPLPIPHYEYQFCFSDMYFSLSNMFQ